MLYLSICKVSRLIIETRLAEKGSLVDLKLNQGLYCLEMKMNADIFQSWSKPTFLIVITFDVFNYSDEIGHLKMIEGSANFSG